MGTGTLTTIGKNEALDALVSTNTTLYLALLDGGVEETGAGIGGTAYARKAITWTVAGASTAGVKANSVAVVFANGGAVDWGAAIDEWGVYDAATAGNQIASGVLDAVRDMSIASAIITFNISAVSLTLSD